MIIFGTRGVTTTGESGSFYCPSCGGQQTYRLRRVRRFFTLYFIPVIPLDQLGEYVECGGCGGTFEPQVLTLGAEDFSAQEQAEREEFLEDLKRVMVLMALADGVADDAEVVAMREFLSQLDAAPPDRERLLQESELARQANTNAVEYVRGIAPQLGDYGKELIVKGAFLVASATGDLHDAHRSQLEQLPAALGITQEQFREIISQISNES